MNDELDKMIETDLPLGPKSVRTVQAKATLSGKADMGKAQMVVPSRNRRAIVSVGFTAEDFALVSEAAVLSHEYISRWIRRAALEKAGHASKGTTWTELRFGDSVPTLTEKRVRELIHEELGWP